MNARGTFARFATAAAVAVSMMVAVSDTQAFRMIQVEAVGRLLGGELVACNHPAGFAHWGTHIIDFDINTAGQAADKGAALSAAARTWNDVPDAYMELQVGGATAAGFATDGINAVGWATDNGCTGNCLAMVALVLQAGQVIVESDITFNEAYTWTTNGGNYDTQAVATHELGHVLGIHHSERTDSPLPTMYPVYTGLDERSLEFDDRSAAQCSQNRYPPPGTEKPSAPGSLRVASRLCDGRYSVTWDAPTMGPVGFYELYVSSVPVTPPQRLLWSGTGRTATVRVTQQEGRRWYQVRACNGSICGPYSNMLALGSFTGC